MSNLQVFDYNSKQVRATGDGRFSVYDVLVAFEVCKDNKRSQETFKRIAEEYSDVSGFCGNFKFTGRGQKKTPVTNEEGMYQILMLCPGKRGAEFRKWAAGILANPDKAIAHGVDKYRKQGKSENWIAQRVKGIQARGQLTDTLKEHGVTEPWQYAVCTDEINKPILGGTAKEVRQNLGLAKSAPLRDNLTDVQNAAINFAEVLAKSKIEENKAHGFSPCKNICSDSANRVAEVLK